VQLICFSVEGLGGFWGFSDFEMSVGDFDGFPPHAPKATRGTRFRRSAAFAQLNIILATFRREPAPRKCEPRQRKGAMFRCWAVSR
jgi:hypothetical protein